jgi:Zn-finger nucleic acid-binding protein
MNGSDELVDGAESLGSVRAMRSPLHPDVVMENDELEPGLNVRKCPRSGGHWISSEAYWRWHDRHEARSTPGVGEVTPSDDSARAALICPESGTLLLRYRVGNELGFFIDRSSATGGIWLDHGEWEALKRAGLHDHLHLVFTSVYQKSLRQQASQQALVNQMRRLLGADFERVAEFREWLGRHPARSRVMAWLQCRE